jgi:hypothetical protein
VVVAVVVAGVIFLGQGHGHGDDHVDGHDYPSLSCQGSSFALEGDLPPSAASHGSPRPARRKKMPRTSNVRGIFIFALGRPYRP